MKKLVIFGAGVATLFFLKKLQKAQVKLEIVLVDPKDYIELPFGMLRALFDAKLNISSRKLIKDLFPNVAHIQSRLETLDKNSAKLSNGKSIKFDYAVLATGAQTRGFSALAPLENQTQKGREDFWQQRGEDIKNASSVLVVGAGITGVELVCEILETYPEKKLTLLSSTERILPTMSKGASKKALKIIKKFGGSVICNEQAEYKDDTESFSINKIKGQSGITYVADIILFALGNKNNVAYMQKKFSHALDASQQIITDSYLHVEGTENIFAMGDISNTHNINSALMAISEAEFLASNFILLAGDKKTIPYNKKKNMNMEKVAMVTLGKKSGIGVFPFGRVDFLVKIKQKDFFTSWYL